MHSLETRIFHGRDCYDSTGTPRRVLEPGYELAYLISEDRARRRLWGEHVEYSVEFGPLPPNPQPSTTDKNGDELERGDLVWFHNQHAWWGRHRSSYTGYVLSTYKGHVEVTSGRGSRVVPICDVWHYHTPKRDPASEARAEPKVRDEDETPRPVTAIEAKPRKSVHRLPPAPEGCCWENHCSWLDGVERIRYVLILESHDEVLGDVSKDRRASHGFNWYSNPTRWDGTGETLYGAAKELASNVAEALERERQSLGA